MQRLHTWLSEKPTSVVIGLTLATGAAAGLQERVWALGSTLWVLLLLPTAVATWYAGRRWGIAIAAVSILLSTIPPVRAREATLQLLLAGGLVLLLTSLKRGAERSRETPRFDSSTGLVNTHALFEFVTSEVERARRYERPFTLIYLSVDNLPVIRQRSGDDGAEEVLRRVAHHLQGSLRTVDVVARLRDREFAVLLPETEVEAARIVLGRIWRTLVAATAEDPEGISFAIGATTWLRAELSVDELHQRTYQLMYEAQRQQEVVRHDAIEDKEAEPVTHRHLTLRR